MERWTTISTAPLLDRRPRLLVEEHAVSVPGGPEIGDWTYVVTPDFVNVAVLGRSGDEWLLFRQTKYACTRSLGLGEVLAPVGGYVEPGEEPLAAARRELREEMALEADEWVRLGSMVADANRGCGVGHLFVAAGARPVAGAGAKDGHDDLEEQALERLTTDELRAAVMAGRFPVHSWSACVSMALLWHQARGARHQQ